MYNTLMPNVQEMDRLLTRKLKEGTIGLRLFVQKNADLTEDDFASDFLQMENMRETTPREVVSGI